MSKSCVLQITKTDLNFTSEQIQHGKARFGIKISQKTIFSHFKVNGADETDDICIQLSASNFSKTLKYVTHHTKAITMKLSKKNNFDVVLNIVIEQVG